MQDENKKKEQLIAELRELRWQFAESEKNITGRKQTHKALRDSEAKYRRIVETASVGIWSLDENFETTFVNTRMVEMLGYDESEMIGRPIHWFMFEENLANLQEKMRDRRAGISDCYERRYRHKDGRTVWVMLSVTPLVDDEDGSFKGSFSMVTDITERKLMEEKLRLSEDKYRSMVETTSDCIWEMDSQERYTYISPKFEDLTGYPPEVFVGRTAHDLLPEGEVHKVRDQVLSSIAAQQAFSSLEVRVRHRDGRMVTVEVSGIPLFTPEGEFRGMRGITRDITKRKHMEKELLRSREELEMRVRERTAALEKANRQLRSFPSKLITAQEEERRRIAGELHDSIGQTLAALKYGVETILVKKGTGDLAGAFKLLERFVPTLQRSIQETRSIYQGLRPPMLDNLGLLATLEWFCREFQSVHSNLQLDLKTRIEEEEIPDHLRVTVFRMVQEALNNVAKHSGAERVELSVAKNQGSIELTIQDDGVGFDLTSITEENGGRSLGLAGMRERVETTGGRLYIESAPDKGTILHALWPM